MAPHEKSGRGEVGGLGGIGGCNPDGPFSREWAVGYGPDLLFPTRDGKPSVILGVAGRGRIPQLVNLKDVSPITIGYLGPIERKQEHEGQLFDIQPCGC